jgi:phosphoribosylformylglycinamidine synthase
LEATRRVLSHPSVADKTFLISIGDRTVGGLICRDQMVGPWQVPVADCGVTAATFDVYSGEAMAMGERTPVAVNNAAASARLAVGEALTNLAAAQVGDLGKVNLSANWMAAPAVPGDAADLYAAVEAVGMELCPALGITIPVGKDSLSMSTVWQDAGSGEKQPRRVTAPISLIVSAFATVADIRLSLTPQLRREGEVRRVVPAAPSASGSLEGGPPFPVGAPSRDARSEAAASLGGDPGRTQGTPRPSNTPWLIGDTVLLLIDLGRGQNRLGGSILAQVASQMGAETPDVDSPADLKNFWDAIQQLGREQKLLAYHDRSDGGLLATAVEMAFAGHVGVTIDLPAGGGTSEPPFPRATAEAEVPGIKYQVPSAADTENPELKTQPVLPSLGEGGNAKPLATVSDVFAALFAEELGAVIQVRSQDLEHVYGILDNFDLAECTCQIGRPTHSYRFAVRQRGHVLLDEDLSSLRMLWSDVTHRIALLRDNPACADQEYHLKLDHLDPGITPKITFAAGHVVPGAPSAPAGLTTESTKSPETRPSQEPGPPVAGVGDPGSGLSEAGYRKTLSTASCKTSESSATAPLGTSRSRLPIVVLREQGVNGQLEMAAAFTRAGFRAIDVHMTDIIGGRVSLKDFRGLVACGGFSYGDVLGGGEGWAKSILFNERARAQFAAFFAREDTFALGVCNGCQMMSALQSIIPGSGHWPRFVQNKSERFEARLVSVKIEKSPSVLLAGMEGSVLPLVTAHGEGFAEFASAEAAKACSESGLVCARFVDNRHRVTDHYPLNPNGSPFGITALTTTSGRVTIIMPHPERVFRTCQLSWHPADWPEDSPWMRLFYNARAWIG